MSVYCMSDIHGEHDRYIAMLEKINFSDDDTLYVIGDVIDRHPGGVDILLDIIGRPNVHMILGNHERMAYDTLGPNNVYGARQLWQQNGGSTTRRELLYHRTPSERNKILRYIRDLPDHLEIDISGQRYHLVHGYPSDNQFDRLWNRPEQFNGPPPFQDKITIIGHTPTVYLLGDDGKPFRIAYGNGIICIDTGCGNKTDLRRLSCLRLDDLAEFYV